VTASPSNPASAAANRRVAVEVIPMPLAERAKFQAKLDEKKRAEEKAKREKEKEEKERASATAAPTAGSAPAAAPR
jgi:hypothetical protein